MKRLKSGEFTAVEGKANVIAEAQSLFTARATTRDANEDENMSTH